MARLVCSVPLAMAGRTTRGCYLVLAPVHLRARGFAADRTYVISIDGVYFGQDRTNAREVLNRGTRCVPGGLPAGMAQVVERLEARDGTRTARTRFTLTRRPGARLEATVGSANSLRAPVEVWGFALTGSRHRVYLHYVNPSGQPVDTTQLGQTGGQCGYLKTAPIRIFPFTPSRGRWMLQIDTRRTYGARPGGPVQRISVQISGR
jgi:hypothetical protein